MCPSPRWAVVSLVLLLGVPACQAEPADKGVRPAECAGSWYPADAKGLASEVDRCLDQADPPSLPGKPAALISPHAGIRYSGTVAAAAYKTLKGRQYKRVIVLGLSHRHPFNGGAILPKVTAYGTPLGNIPVDREVCDQLLARPDFAPHDPVHHGEHSLEIQLPFLQRVIQNWRLVPIMVGEVDLAAYDRMASAIAPFVDDDTLLVASTDFTHYGRRFLFVPFTEKIPENLQRIDFSSAEAIMALDAPGFLKKLNENGVGNRRMQTICGRGPVTLLIMVLNRVAMYKGVRLAYDTSGRMTGDWDNSVSYVAIGFVKTGDKPKLMPSSTSSKDAQPLSPQERAVLLRLARDAAMRALAGQSQLNPRLPQYTLTDRLQARGAAFVTLKNHGRLRGCIGSLIAQGPLVDSVVSNAVNAATTDYRFRDNPVTAKEMKDVTIDISVLSPPRLIEDPKEIVLGKHGVILTRGRRRSVYLPQVATETGWDLETFLSRLSLKANLPADAWRRHGTRLEVFTAEVFGEPEKPHASK